MVIYMSKTKDIIEEKIEKNKILRDELVKKGVNHLDEKIKSEKYTAEALFMDTELGSVYHDLIDSEDKLNSKHQRKYNQTYHAMDVELYKLNQKIDRKARMVDYNINNKKDKLFKKIKNNLY